MHVIGTAGHVDHGKSTLVQRLTGIDPDRFAEEKRRGLTIDLGFAWLTLPSGREIGLVDVPGHERFIKNMLAGAGGISVCLFVVAANEGWMPQSSEHLAILDVLGVTHGVVALTKRDTVDEETLELALAEVEEHLAHSSLKAAPVVPCSGVTGEGLDALVAEIDRAVSDAPPPVDLGRPRLWIDRVFTISGAGTVVTGTLTGGSLAVGDEVEISPEARRARIRSIQSHKKELTNVGPGNRVALNLAGLERQGAERGDAIVTAGQWLATTRIDAHLRVVPSFVSGRDHLLTEKGAHLLYVGSAETPVRLKLLGEEALAAGESGFAELYLRDPLPLERGDRFVLRDAGRILTFGGGEILDPMPRPARRADRDRLRLLTELHTADPPHALRALVAAQGAIDAREASLRTGADAPAEDVMRLGALLVSRQRHEELAGEVQRALASHHRGHPLERGLAREAVRAPTGLDPESFDRLVESLDGVVEEGALLRLGSHRVTLDRDQQAEKERLLQRIDEGGFSPPLGKELQADPALLHALTDSGELVRIEDFYLTAGRAAEAQRRVRAAIEQRGPLTVAEIRDLLGTSRKYAVPLCEWLDATGTTRRRGDVRGLGPRSP